MRFSTYDGREEAGRAKRPERHCERERSEEENDGQQEDVGDRVGDVVVVAGVAGERPASVGAQVLGDAVPAHLDASVGVVTTVRVQLAHPRVTARRRRRYVTIRYDTRCYSNVRSKADLIYCTETTTKKCKTEKLKSKNRYAQK